MSQQREKRIASLDPKSKKKLLAIVQDVFNRHIHQYDVKKMIGHEGLRRIRVGDMRIIFGRDEEGSGIIKRIDFRGDAYKSF